MLLLLINGTWRVPPYFILVSLWPPRIHGRWLRDRAFPVRHYCKRKQKVIMPSELIELNSVLYKLSKLSWLLSPQIFRYLCMSPERFKHLLTLVGPLITKKTTKMLTSGDDQQSLAFSYCLGRTTVSHILRETCSAILKALGDIHVGPQSSPDDWREISKEFEDLWNWITVKLPMVQLANANLLTHKIEWKCWQVGLQSSTTY